MTTNFPTCRVSGAGVFACAISSGGIGLTAAGAVMNNTALLVSGIVMLTVPVVCVGICVGVTCIVINKLRDAEEEVNIPEEVIKTDKIAKDIIIPVVEIPDAPEPYTCPITFVEMKDPYITPRGHSYEKEALEKWIKEKGNSPQTRDPLTLKDIRPNRNLREAIEHSHQPAQVEVIVDNNLTDAS